MKFAVVGSGLSGAIIANELAKRGFLVDLYESRSHIGGNCYTERDTETNVMVHKYGPHIFHTDNKEVWDYVTSLTDFMPFINRVKTTTCGSVFSLPINLHTINQFFGRTFSPSEARNYIETVANADIVEAKSFEDQALKFVGKDLYEAFFRGYTLKQWGVDPKDLPASILKRLPLRFNYDDNYFNHKYQGMPVNGYTPIFEKLLSHLNINLHIGKMFSRKDAKEYKHVFYTGPIDAWFEHSDGRLGYRTLDFKNEIHDGDYQGCAVMNYPCESVKYTRICEHKHFSPWENHQKTYISFEFSRDCTPQDIPYYPIRLVNEAEMLKVYVAKAQEEKGVSFLGRLGTYRYLDMDVTIAEALAASRVVLRCLGDNKEIPSFFTTPI